MSYEKTKNKDTYQHVSWKKKLNLKGKIKTVSLSVIGNLLVMKNALQLYCGLDGICVLISESNIETFGNIV